MSFENMIEEGVAMIDDASRRLERQREKHYQEIEDYLEGKPPQVYFNWLKDIYLNQVEAGDFARPYAREKFIRKYHSHYVNQINILMINSIGEDS